MLNTETLFPLFVESMNILKSKPLIIKNVTQPQIISAQGNFCKTIIKPAQWLFLSLYFPSQW